MKKIKLIIAAVALSSLSACSGSVYNQSKDCSYDYILHPAVSVSAIIGGCGEPARK